MADILASLEGRVVTDARFESETLEWVLQFGDGCALQIASPWRLLEGGSIVLGRSDHGQKHGMPAPVDAAADLIARLAGRRVQEAKVHGEGADLAISFEGETRLEVFNDSAGYEAWQLNAPDSPSEIAQGGGRLVTWDADA